MNKLVSIIVPTYNSEKYIVESLQSITNQTYKNIEIIVINDGSNDGTKEILDAISKTDSRIIIINKENEGVSKARNKGIDACKGEYIFFFDSDDIIESKCIEKVMIVIELKKYDTVLYGYASVRNKKILKHKLAYENNEYLSNSEIIKKIIPRSFGISYDELNKWLKGERSIRQGKELTGPWRMCYSAKIIKENKVKYNECLKVGEDTIFTNEYLSFTNRVGIINDCLYYLHNHEDSTISKYLQNINNVISNKRELIKVKHEISKEIYLRTGINPNIYWGGEVILSTVEIAWILTDKKNSMNFLESYKKYKEFRKDRYVNECWNEMKCSISKSINNIPILLIKCKMDFFMLLIMKFLRKFNFEIHI